MGSMLRPAAKAAIKGAMVFYQESVAEIGEMASDLVAEAWARREHGARDGNQARLLGAIRARSRCNRLGEVGCN